MPERFRRQHMGDPTPSAERPARLGVETSLGQEKGVEPVGTCKTVCLGSGMQGHFLLMLPAIPLKLFMERHTWGCRPVLFSRPSKSKPSP